MTGKKIISASENRSSEGGIFQIKNIAVTNIVNPPRRIPSDADFVFDGLAVLICLKGNCVINVNYREYTLEENRMLIIMPYRIISILKHSEDCIVSGFFLGVDYYMKNNMSGPDYDIIMQLKRYPLATLTDKQMGCLMDLYSVISEWSDNIDCHSEESLKALVFSFMAEIKYLYDKNNPEVYDAALTRQEKITDNFFQLLMDNFKGNRTLAFYADKLCITPKYLSTVIKKITGYTVLEWINEMVINHTKSLLKTTDKTVLEISEDMNFSSPSFFGKFFKQYTGLTPLQFRHQ